MMNGLPPVLHPPDPAVRLRPVTYTDVDMLRRSCWPNRPFGVVYNLVQRAIHTAHSGRGGGWVVLGERNEAVGFGQVAVWPTCAEISDLVVAEPLRGQGIGTALIQKLVRECLRLDMREIEIGAAFSNPRALALYLRLGFEESHTLMVALEGGEPERVQYLRLSVP
jgi:GNAT superfamily N-acetyltransferase